VTKFRTYLTYFRDLTRDRQTTDRQTDAATETEGSYSCKCASLIIQFIVITRKPCCRKDVAAVVFGLKFADNSHYK